MKRLFDYARLRRLGFPISTAWKASSVFCIGWMEWALVLLWLTVILGSIIVYMDAELRERDTGWIIDSYIQKARADKYEAILIGCFNDSDISIDRVNHLCQIRAYEKRDIK